MASTDAKSGFRLPWSGDRNESEDQTATPEVESTAVDPDQQQNDSDSESETPTMIDTPPTTSGEAAQAEPDATEQATTPEATATAAPERKANKFMADLTRAMQAAAESARADTLERFSTDAKAHIEGIHASSAEEATDLRKRADDDIAGIREWSKTEIARIREETDERVTDRKERLEREIETHAGEIEARIERVQNRVATFEAEMAAFFERLLAEDDPTRFAAMAETLPEPPPFDADEAWASIDSQESVQVADDAPAAEYGEAVEASAETDAVEAPEASETTETTETPAAEYGEAAEASAETAPVESPAESTVDTGDLFGIAADAPAGEPAADTDPRLSAIGVEHDFAAAEAEAAAYPAQTPDGDNEIPTIAEDALAARLAGLVAEDQKPSDSASTRVVVTGLVSVASIAGFKRNLARVAGVRSVGVSSGPDGEFVFAVTHDPGLALSDGIATLSGFGARVTDEAPGELTVAARDPESES